MMRSGRNKNWAETMVNLEARKLINTANTLSSFHLRDGYTRLKFVQEIKEVVEQQFAVARRAISDEVTVLMGSQKRSVISVTAINPGQREYLQTVLWMWLNIWVLNLSRDWYFIIQPR